MYPSPGATLLRCLPSQFCPCCALNYNMEGLFFCTLMLRFGVKGWSSIKRLCYRVCRGGLDEKEARWFFKQLILALDYCHKMVRRLFMPTRPACTTVDGACNAGPAQQFSRSSSGLESQL